MRKGALNAPFFIALRQRFSFGKVFWPKTGARGGLLLWAPIKPPAFILQRFERYLPRLEVATSVLLLLATCRPL